MAYSKDNKGLKAVQNKDRRISWLSIFSSICGLEKSISLKKAVEETDRLVAELFRKFPFPDQEISAGEAEEKLGETARQERLEMEEAERMNEKLEEIYQEQYGKQ